MKGKEKGVRAGDRRQDRGQASGRQGSTTARGVKEAGTAPGGGEETPHSETPGVQARCHHRGGMGEASLWGIVPRGGGSPERGVGGMGPRSPPLASKRYWSRGEGARRVTMGRGEYPGFSRRAPPTPPSPTFSPPPRPSRVIAHESGPQSASPTRGRRAAPLLPICTVSTLKCPPLCGRLRRDRPERAGTNNAFRGVPRHEAMRPRRPGRRGRSAAPRASLVAHDSPARSARLVEHAIGASEGRACDRVSETRRRRSVAAGTLPRPDCAQRAVARTPSFGSRTGYPLRQLRLLPGLLSRGIVSPASPGPHASSLPSVPKPLAGAFPTGCHALRPVRGLVPPRCSRFPHSDSRNLD